MTTNSRKITVTQQFQRQVEIEITEEEWARLDKADTSVEIELMDRAKGPLANATLEHVMYTAATQGGEELFDLE